VIIWWGLLNNELYVEKDDRRYGPFHPVDGPIPLHRYRNLRKPALKNGLTGFQTANLPRAALDGNTDLQFLASSPQVPEMNSTPSATPIHFRNSLI